MQFEKEEFKRRVCPFVLEEDIAKKIGGAPKRISESGLSALQVEVSTLRQSREIETKKVMGKGCVIREHATFNRKKELNYIHNIDLTDITSSKTGLQEHYPVTDITRATWIKTREVTTIPLLLNFSTAELPEYLRVTGEYTLTRVCPYNERPLQCKNCQKYIHTHKKRDVLVEVLFADSVLDSIQLQNAIEKEHQLSVATAGVYTQPMQWTSL